jgi:phospholipid/cholesterol/gamma-HCH transport system substrate-binding protein
MCESDERYVPLNDGNNWKGDPNATLSGQPIPQPLPETPPAASPAPPPIAIVEYDPNTGTYTGPDGKQYTQTDLTHGANHQKWQDLLVPPNGN